MKKSLKKLALHKETICNLQEPHLAKIAGGLEREDGEVRSEYSCRKTCETCMVSLCIVC